MALAGGEEVLNFCGAVTRNWAQGLRLGGPMMVGVGIDQAEQVRDLMQAEGFENLKIHPDTAGISRVVEGRIPLD